MAIAPKTAAERAEQRARQSAKRERRAHLRARVDFPVALCSRVWQDDRVLLAEAVDLSAGGIAVRCQERLGLNDDLTIAIPVAHGEKPIVVHGRLTSRRRSADAYIHGFRFIDVGLKTRVVLIRLTFRAAAAAVGAKKR